jgi:hypothetical protein
VIPARRVWTRQSIETSSVTVTAKSMVSATTWSASMSVASMATVRRHHRHPPVVRVRGLVAV